MIEKNRRASIGSEGTDRVNIFKKEMEKNNCEKGMAI